MIKTKRVNPNRQPISRATLRKQLDRMGDAFLMICLFAMREAKFEPEQIRRFVIKFQAASEAYLKEDISIKDIQTAIGEYEAELKQLDDLEVKRDMGYDPYVMIYNKPNADRELRRLQRWCNNKILFKSCKRFEDYCALK